MSEIKNVFIVDDDIAVRDSLAMQMEGAGYTVTTFSGASDFLDACTPDTQGCIILDVSMPGMDGPSMQDELARRGFKLPIIFLSGQGTIPLTVRTMKAGAIDFLTKPVEGAALRGRVQEALKRCADMQNQTKDSQIAAARLANLTEREREIMMLSIAGHSCKEIALRLAISYRTVETHRTHIMQKTGVSNMLELTQIVRSHETR
jgi:FixJ family two-component response regulator